MRKKLLILFVPIICACSLKQNIKQEEQLAKVIDDFVVLYNENNFENSLKSILIYYLNQERIFISDIPLETIASSEQENQIIGNYKDIYFEMYATETTIFKNPDFQIYTKEKISQLFPKLMLEYNPKIEVIYNFKTQKKTIKKNNSIEEKNF